MDQKITDAVNKWEVINPECVLILQDEAKKFYSSDESSNIATVMDASGNKAQIILPESVRKKDQTAVGTGVILKMRDDAHDSVAEGDKIKFSPGTQVHAGFPENNMIQILHINNILMRQV